MKALIAILVSGITLSSSAQIVVFRNAGVTFPTPADRLVYRDYVGGVKLVGTNYVAGLWFVPGTDGALVDGRISPDRGVRTGVNCPFRVQTTVSPGAWLVPAPAGSTFVLTGMNGGEVAMLQVRVWDVVKFSTFAAAFAGGEFGASEPFSYTVPQPGAVPGSEYMDNLRAFAMMVDGRTVNIDDLVVAEGSNGVFQADFTLALNQAQPEPVSVNYATADGTALAGSDYVAANGTITFAPGELTRIVSIMLTADIPPEDDETFYLNLSNPVNGHLARSQAICTITEVRVVSLSVDTTVSINTVANHRYVVERTINMVVWEPVAGATNVLGTGDIVTVVDRGSGCEGARAYRARLLTD